MGTRSQQGGYTIVEVIISLFIIGVVLVIYAASSNTIILTRNARSQELALRIASTKMEDLRHTAYASLPSTGSFAHTLLSSLPSGQATMTITDYNNTTKQVVVTVTWQEVGISNTHTVSLTSLMNQNGL